MTLTRKDVIARVNHIGRVADRDPEWASDKERELWSEVLEHAADGHDVGQLAQLALGTRNHVFGRH